MCLPSFYLTFSQTAGGNSFPLHTSLASVVLLLFTSLPLSYSQSFPFRQTRPTEQCESESRQIFLVNILAAIENAACLLFLKRWSFVSTHLLAHICYSFVSTQNQNRMAKPGSDFCDILVNYSVQGGKKKEI